MLAVAPVKQLRHLLAKADVLGSRAQITCLQLLNRLGIILGEAPGIRTVPGPVFEVERHLRYVIFVLGKVRAYGAPLFSRVALPKIGITQPSPVLAMHHGVKQWLAGLNVLFKSFYRVRIEAHV